MTQVRKYVSLEVTPDVYRQLKVYCAERGLKIGITATQFIQKGVEEACASKALREKVVAK